MTRVASIPLAALLLAGCGPEAADPVLPLEPAAAVPHPAPAPETAPGSPVPEARPPIPLDLPRCLALAEARSERLSGVVEDIRIAEAGRALARGAALPTLTGHLEHRRQERVNRPAGSAASSGNFLEERTEHRLTLDQPLFQGFRDVYAYRSAGLLEESARRGGEAALLEVRVMVCEAYARVLSADRQAEAIDSSLRLAADRLAELKARLEAGLARRTDVLLAEAQVARQEALRTGVEGERSDARAFLAFLLGVPVDGTLAPFPDFPPPPADPVPLAERARSRRADLAALERRARAAEQDVKTASTGHWPAVDLEGNLYGRREGQLEDVDWDLALLGSLPLFEGGRTAATVRAAEAEARKARLALEERRRQVLQEVQEALSAHRTARAMLESLGRETAAAAETDLLLQEEARQGIATQIERLTAQDTLLAARVTLARQILAERIAALRVWAVAGDFPIPIPPAPENAP